MNRQRKLVASNAVKLDESERECWGCEMWTILLTHYVVLLFTRHPSSAEQQARPGLWRLRLDPRLRGGRGGSWDLRRERRGMFIVAVSLSQAGAGGGRGTELTWCVPLPSSLSPQPSARTHSEQLNDAIFSCISQQRVVNVRARMSGKTATQICIYTTGYSLFCYPFHSDSNSILLSLTNILPKMKESLVLGFL